MLIFANQPRARMLVIYLLCQCVLMTTNFAEEALGARSYLLITPVFTLATGPLVYFLFKNLLHANRDKQDRRLVHFLPVLLALPFTEYTQLVIAFGTVSQLIYFAFTVQLVGFYQQASAEIRADVNTCDLQWIRTTVVLFVIFALVDLVRLNMQTYNDISTKALWYFIDLVWLLAINLYLVVKVHNQPHLEDSITQAQEITFNEVDKQSEDPTEIFNAIHNTIMQHYLYRQPRLTIHDVAEVIGLGVKDISWAINTCGGYNFNEYINSLRVDEVKQQLQCEKQTTPNLLALAMNAGFNSKSSFNSVFKKQTGYTPSQFSKLI